MRVRLALVALGALLGGIGSVHAQTVPAGTGTVMAGPASSFTGRVTVRLLTSPMPPGQAGTALVTFAPSARSNWHTHPAGQTLYVTAGCGWTQTEGSPVIRICKGDTIYVKPGVRHWHGATVTTPMTHLAISELRDGENVGWMEPVSDADYSGPAR